MILRKLHFSLVALILLVTIGHSTISAADPGQPDTVAVDSIASFVSSSGIVPVRFFNDEELAAIEITLTRTGNGVILDSFSFVGGRLESLNSKGFTIDSARTTITIFGFAGVQLIATGNGPLGSLYFSYPSSISPQLVSIDSTSVIMPQIFRTTQFNAVSETFTPQFRRGYLDILPDPPAFDSVWLKPARAEPGQVASVELSLYNDLSLTELAVALQFDENVLTIDSMTLDGAREVGFHTGSLPLQRRNSTGELLVHLTFDESNPLPPGRGSVARLHFGINPQATPGITAIDSTNYSPPIWNTFVVQTAAAGGLRFTPFFVPGTVEVLVPTAVDDQGNDNNLPVDFALHQNYPNPFNPTTEIEFSLPSQSPVRLDIFNLLGQKVTTLIDDELSAGRHRVRFEGRYSDGNNLPSGIYFYRLSAGRFVATRKMMLLK